MLTDCPNCWDTPCHCADGGEWRYMSKTALLEVKAAIDAALALHARGEAPPDRWAKIPENAKLSDLMGEVRIPIDADDTEAHRLATELMRGLGRAMRRRR